MSKKYTQIVLAVPAPPGATLPETALTAGAAWTHTFTFTANKYRYAHVRMKLADAFVVFKAGTTNPAKDGCSYPAHAPIKIDIPRDANTLHIKRDDAANDATVTFSLMED